MKTYDIVIIGGGPAGLSAAVYGSRALRSVLVIDNSEGRSSYNQTNENYLGFPKGIKARKLRELGKKQAEKFGAEFAKDEVVDVKKKKTGFTLKGLKGSYGARTVILAQGVTDYFPVFHGSERYVGRSLFWCLLCDGYKVQGKRVALLGFDDEAVNTLKRLKEYTKDIVFLTNCDETGDKISDVKRKELKKMRVPLHYGSIEKVTGEKEMVKEILLDTGERVKADVIFSRQGAHPNVDLASKLEVILEGKAYVKTDIDKRTNVPYVYAAGDMTSATAHQISTAVFEGATAATSADHDLREGIEGK
jgi:thioredoxin reductase (NADPH)